MGSATETAWSYAFKEADWARQRLVGRPGSHVSSVIPGGFEAYARVLHPATLDDRKLRWAEVGSQSNLELHPDARFHSVALPPELPDGSEVPLCRAPQKGSLTAADAASLTAYLRAGTDTPDDCWFCLWEGHAWQGVSSEVIPQRVMEAPKIKLSGRDYVLYSGSVEAGALATGPRWQSPNWWWPQDQSWCVVSDIDLPWTYVGASQRTIDALLGAPGIEVLPAAETDPVQRIEDWVQRWAAVGTDDLMRNGHCRIDTTRGVVTAWFERPGLEPGALGVTTQRVDGHQGGRRTRIEHRSEPELRHLLSLHLTVHVVDLVEG